MIGKGNLNLLAQAWLGAALLCMAGCSSNSVATPVTSGTATTSFTTADLSGTYVFSAKGSNTDDGDYAVLGTFTADGNGKITSGEADYNFGTGVDSAVLISGSYAVNGTGTAVITITDKAAMQDNITVTLVKGGGVQTITGYGLNGTGTLTPSTAAGFSPVGTYTYTLTGEQQNAVTANGTAVVGSNLTISSGTNVYTDNGRTINQTTNAGFVGTPNSLGRSYASFAGHTFALYPITSTSYALIGIDENALLTGTGTKQ